MRALLDYRPALRDRSGVGEYVHELAAALTDVAPTGHTVELFSSSWRDRPDPRLSAELPGIVVHDCRVPVRVLNWWWHQAGMPAVEHLVGGPFDVVHAAHALLIPSRGASIVTIHDLDFLDHPDRTTAEIRRDYGRLVGTHARRADGILTSSLHSARRIVETLSVPPERVVVAPPGPPRWTSVSHRAPRNARGHILFIGTIEPRKNLGTLLDAYASLCARTPGLPPLWIAGRPGAGADAWLRRLAEPPFAGRVRHLGYVPDDERRALFEGASVLVIPSWYEGFGLPALEAMALGVPVVASDRGALPEVVGEAGLLVPPDRADAIAEAIRRMLFEEGLAAACVERGRARAGALSWERSARAVWALYAAAVERRTQRHAHRR